MTRPEYSNYERHFNSGISVIHHDRQDPERGFRLFLSGEELTEALIVKHAREARLQETATTSPAEETEKQ